MGALFIELSNKLVAYAGEAWQFRVHFDREGEPVVLEIMDTKASLLGFLESLIKETGSVLPCLIRLSCHGNP